MRWRLEGISTALVAPMLAVAMPMAGTYASSTPTCHGKPATIIGTRGNDKLVGTNGPDVIVGLEGDDQIRGRGGDDTICLGSGDYQVASGGRGDDRIQQFRYSQDSRLKGGFGADLLVTGPGFNALWGGPGNDILRGGGRDTLFGGSGADVIRGGPEYAHIIDVVVHSSEQKLSAGGTGGHVWLEFRDRSAVTISTDVWSGTLTFIDLGVEFPLREYRSLEIRTPYGDTWDSPGSWHAIGDKSDNDFVSSPFVALTVEAGDGDDYLVGSDYDDTMDGGPGTDVGRPLGGIDTCINVEEPGDCENIR